MDQMGDLREEYNKTTGQRALEIAGTYKTCRAQLVKIAPSLKDVWLEELPRTYKFDGAYALASRAATIAKDPTRGPTHVDFLKLYSHLLVSALPAVLQSLDALRTSVDVSAQSGQSSQSRHGRHANSANLTMTAGDEADEMSVCVANSNAPMTISCFFSGKEGHTMARCTDLEKYVSIGIVRWSAPKESGRSKVLTWGT